MKTVRLADLPLPALVVLGLCVMISIILFASMIFMWSGI